MIPDVPFIKMILMIIKEGGPGSVNIHFFIAKKNSRTLKI